jgi:hypothetical protein
MQNQHRHIEDIEHGSYPQSIKVHNAAAVANLQRPYNTGIDKHTDRQSLQHADKAARGCVQE